MRANRLRTSRLFLLAGLMLGVFLGGGGCFSSNYAEEASDGLPAISSKQAINEDSSGEGNVREGSESNQVEISDESSPNKDDAKENQVTADTDPPNKDETGLDEGYVQEIPTLYAVWVRQWSITTPERADQVIAQLEAGRFNAAFVRVFDDGYAYYNSTLLKKDPDLAPDHDPLAYFVEQAHQRGIAVHAWLATGKVGSDDGGLGPILSQRPEWAMVRPDGGLIPVLNFARPDVTRFVGDIALELVQNYNLDGIHFDRLRYTADEASFDSYSAQLFAQEHNLDLEPLRYAELPAFAKFFRGNPLVGVESAQVLASFDFGHPAILLNNYGDGRVILFNWQAQLREIAASSEILRRSVNYLTNENSRLYVLRSETNAEKYGFDRFDQGVAWLNDLGWSPIEIGVEDINTLNADSVLVLPNVYLINPQEAVDLANFVYKGGEVIFIDGPTPSIHDENIQAITGMRSQGRSYGQPGVLMTASDHDLIPVSDRELLTLKKYQSLNTQWETFRAEGINKLLEDVYQRVKQTSPEVLVTITVADNQEILNHRHFLDWQSWLEEEYIDLIIPRAYVEQKDDLAPVIAQWQPSLSDSNRIMLGLITSRGEEFKEPAQVLAEIELALNSGSNGVILFHNDSISDDVLSALAQGPFSSPNVNYD